MTQTAKAEGTKVSAKEAKEALFEKAVQFANAVAKVDAKEGSIEVADSAYLSFMAEQGHDMAKAKELRDDTALYIGAAHKAASFKALDVLKENTDLEKVETDISLGFMGRANGVVHRNREVRVPKRGDEPETTKVIAGFNRLSFDFIRGTAASPLNNAIAAVKEKGASLFGN